MQTRYFNSFVLTVATLLAVTPLFAQPTTRVQLIHNAADPAAAVVDIYIDQLSTEDPIGDDVAFRTATPFLDLPTGIPVTVSIAPGDSDSAEDRLTSFDFTLDASLTYQIVANGVLDPDSFESNPDGRATAFDLLVNTTARETGSDMDEVDINVIHGATDAPTVDVVARIAGSSPPGGIIVDDAAYSDITPYLSVPAGSYELDITTADNAVTVATFAADLSGAGGSALTVLASGFLSPDNDQDGPAFGLLAVFPDGTAALLPAPAEARLQVIHNAADPAAAVVDVYVEEISVDTPFIEDFAFRTATPYVSVPAGTDLTVTVAPGDSESAKDGIASFSYNLDADETYQLIANGVLTPGDFEANPSGEAIGFTLFVNAAGQEASTEEDEVQFNVVHGSTDAPAVDVIARDVATLVDGAVYGDITGYIGVPAGSYLLDVTPDEDNDTIVATFAADLSGAAGGALTVLASGFLSPGNDQNGPAFGLLAVAPDGNAFLLPAPSEARVQIIHNAADPAAEVVDIYSGGELLVDDFAFRTATPFLTVLAGFDLDIVIAPGSSTSPLDGIFGQSLVLDAGGTYQVVANGVLDPDSFEANPDGEDIGFTLFVNTMAQEASTEDDEVQFNVVHGSTDAPTVDVIARDVATLVDDATYGDITGYIGVPAGAYTLDVTTADGSVTAATFAADLSGAAGGALTVLASGFLSPGNDQNGPAFGLLAVFPDGTTALLPPGSVSNENGASVPASFEVMGAYPNPLTTSAAVAFSLASEARVGLEVYDVLGRRVLRITPEARSAGADQEIAVDARSLPSGAYIYRLTAETPTENFVRTGRMTVVR